MKHPDNRIIVRYPKAGMRVRNVQSTVYPSRQDLGTVTSYDEWNLYLRFCIDARYGASRAIEITFAGEELVKEAKKILNQAAA